MNDSFKKLLCNFKQGLSYVTLREEKKKKDRRVRERMNMQELLL